MKDASIRAQTKSGGYAGDDYKVEIVSPILGYDDIETLQEIIRLLRKGKAIANESCGCHLHIGSDAHTARSLKNIISMMHSKEDLLFRALGVSQDRASRWCKKVDSDTLARINRIRDLTVPNFRKAWYNGRDGAHERYNSTRYANLNLHSVFQKGTIEFRAFDSKEVLKHAGFLKAIIQLVFAICHKSKEGKSASSKKLITNNAKYSMRVWLNNLGLIGEEFKTARHHLLKNLDGDCAWRDNRRAA